MLKTEVAFELDLGRWVGFIWLLCEHRVRVECRVGLL